MVLDQFAASLHAGLYRLLYVTLSTGNVMDMYKSIAWELAVPLVLGAVLSVPMATLTVSRTSEASLRGIVGVVTLALGMVALLKLI